MLRTGCALVLALLAAQLRTSSTQEEPITRPGALESRKQCFGYSTRTRSCHFQDLLYDKETQRFLFLTSDATVLNDPKIQPALDNTDYIQLGLSKLAPGTLFKVSFQDAPFPAEADTCEAAHAFTYLHAGYHENTFGHMLRDNMNAILHNLRLHKLSFNNYQLLLLNLPSVPTVWRKYGSYAAPELETWDAALARCSRRYIRFPNFIAGYGGRDLRWANPAMCAAGDLLLQRDAAYARHGVAHIPVKDSTAPISVLILDKSTADKRRIDNIPEVLDALKARFPDMQIDSRDMAATEPSAQLSLLSTTTIFISPIGSASFRLLYLPTGAHAILVGAPEREVGSGAFREVDGCWANMQYVSISKYHVTEPGESKVRATREHWKHDAVRYQGFLNWDADSHLDPVKLGNLVETAAASIKQLRSQAD